MFYADEYKPDFGYPFPTWTPEELDQKTEAELKNLYSLKTQIEANAKVEPVTWGWTLPGWQQVMDEWANYTNHVILGGNRSSKSSFAARLVVDAALRIPEARIRCYHVNDERSIAEQQGMIWEALPTRLKALSKHKGRAYSLGYNQKNGFTGGKIVFPAQPGCARGSEIVFTNYQSYKNDAQTAEGWWAHLVWGDEEMPQKLFETLQYRLVDARGRLVLTFTTLNGWSPLIADVMGRTKVLSKRHAPLLNRDIPDAMESLSRSRTRLYFFWTEDQRFIPVDDFVESLKGRPADEIMARAYGIPTKSSQSPFPTFDETVHVVPHETLPFVLDPHYKVTRYHVVDPSGSKPWFMIWAAVDAACCYIYREWPDIAYGEWAEAGEGPEGKAGPAQRPLAWGIRDYVDHIQQCEIGENVFERIIDPRLGAAPVQGKEGATSIITELDDMGLTMIPSPGLQIDHGLMLINSALKFNQAAPLSATNAPKLRISDRCQNTIFALKNFTNQGGKDEATKDPIDCLRYLLMTGADYVDQQEAKRARTWSY